jgi:hypothetical protein
VPNQDEYQKETPSKLAQLVDSHAWTPLCVLIGTAFGFLALAEFRTGPIIGGIVGLAAYFLLAFALPNRIKRQSGNKAPTVNGPLPQNDPDPRVDLLVEAHQHAATLAAAQVQMPLAIGEIVNALHRHALAIIDEVSNEPAKLTPVLRFFTYYLPSTADLVMDRIKLAPHAGSARLAEIDQTLTRLVEAFAGFQAAVLAPDLQSVDLDVELLDQALNADLEELKR